MRTPRPKGIPTQILMLASAALLLAATSIGCKPSECGQAEKLATEVRESVSAQEWESAQAKSQEIADLLPDKGQLSGFGVRSEQLAEAAAGMKKRGEEATSPDEFDGAYKRWQTAYDGSFARVCR